MPRFLLNFFYFFSFFISPKSGLLNQKLRNREISPLQHFAGLTFESSVAKTMTVLLRSDLCCGTVRQNYSRYICFVYVRCKCMCNTEHDGDRIGINIGYQAYKRLSEELICIFTIDIVDFA